MQVLYRRDGYADSPERRAESACFSVLSAHELALISIEYQIMKKLSAVFAVLFLTSTIATVADAGWVRGYIKSNGTVVQPYIRR